MSKAMKVHLVVSFIAQGIPVVACGAWSGTDASAYRRHVTCKNCRRTYARRKRGAKR